MFSAANKRAKLNVSRTKLEACLWCFSHHVKAHKTNLGFSFCEHLHFAGVRDLHDVSTLGPQASLRSDASQRLGRGGHVFSGRGGAARGAGGPHRDARAGRSRMGDCYGAGHVTHVAVDGRTGSDGSGSGNP